MHIKLKIYLHFKRYFDFFMLHQHGIDKGGYVK